MKPKVLAVRTVLFDWDGTLLDSFVADARAYSAMFAALGIEWTLRDLERHYHPDWYRVYRAARIERVLWRKADLLWRGAYRREAPKLLPYARATLRALKKRFTLGLVSSGDRARVRRQLQEMDLADYFSVCVCSEDAPRKKPHPAPLQVALQKLALSPRECVYVGDSPQDVAMARSAGVTAIGIPGPFPTEAGLRASRPALLLDSIRELPRYVHPMSFSRSGNAAASEMKSPATTWSVRQVRRKTPRNRSDA